jgi:hypothetical protein
LAGGLRGLGGRSLSSPIHGGGGAPPAGGGGGAFGAPAPTLVE